MDVPHNGRYRYRRNTSGIQAHRITADSGQPSGVAAGQERLTGVNASFPSCYGDIKSSWKKENDGTVSYQVTIPANTTATLHLLLPTLDYVVEESGKLP